MRILIVEDYAPVRKAVAKGLKEASFAVAAAAIASPTRGLL